MLKLPLLWKHWLGAGFQFLGRSGVAWSSKAVGARLRARAQGDGDGREDGEEEAPAYDPANVLRGDACMRGAAISMTVTTISILNHRHNHQVTRLFVLVVPAVCHCSGHQDLRSGLILS